MMRALIVAAVVVFAGCATKSADTKEAEPDLLVCQETYWDGIFLDCTQASSPVPAAPDPPSDWVCESPPWTDGNRMSWYSDPAGTRMGWWFQAADRWHEDGIERIFGDLRVTSGGRTWEERFYGGLDLFVPIDGMPPRGEWVEVSFWLQVLEVRQGPEGKTIDDATVLDVTVLDGHVPVLRFHGEQTYEYFAPFRKVGEDHTVYLWPDVLNIVDDANVTVAQFAGGQWAGSGDFDMPAAPLLPILDDRCP